MTPAIALLVAAALTWGAAGCGESPPSPASAPDPGVMLQPPGPVLLAPPWSWIAPVWMMPTPASASAIATVRPTVLDWNDSSLSNRERHPVLLGSLAANGGPIADLERRTEEWKLVFRACFASALKAQPRMLGGVRLMVLVEPDGSVSDVATSTGGWVSHTLVDCLRTRMEREVFAPAEGGATITLQLSLWQGFSAPDAPASPSDVVLKKAPKS